MWPAVARPGSLRTRVVTQRSGREGPWLAPPPRAPHALYRDSQLPAGLGLLADAVLARNDDAGGHAAEQTVLEDTARVLELGRHNSAGQQGLVNTNHPNHPTTCLRHRDDPGARPPHWRARAQGRLHSLPLGAALARESDPDLRLFWGQPVHLPRAVFRTHSTADRGAVARRRLAARSRPRRASPC